MDFNVTYFTQKFEKQKIDDLQKRRKNILHFFKKFKKHIPYFLLGFIIWLGAFIRTRNLKLLQGRYLLSSDSFLFLRYASYIIEHGKLMTTDMMRYFPLGFNPKGERLLLAYILAYFYKFVNLFIPSLKFIQFDIIYPVIFFCASIIIFYLLVKKLFNYKVAILSTAFLAVIPTFLHRTMAGFSDKEPIGIFLMFLIFYFYVLAFQSKQFKFSILFGSLAGISTGLMILIWGACELILLIIPSFVLIEFFLNRIKKRHFYAYFCWFIVWLILSKVLLKKASLIGILALSRGGIPFLVFLLILINHIIIEKNLFKIKEKIKNKLPTTFFSLIIVIIIIFMLTSLLFGPSFIFSKIGQIKDAVIHPMGVDRFVLTVRETKQTYFSNWKSEFHWFFWLFFIGSILLFYNLIKPLKKYKYFLTTAFTLFLSIFIFSRYSPGSILNGENFISTFLYFGSLIIFVLLIIVFYLYTYYKDKETHKKIINLNKSFVFVFIWFLLMIIATMGATRIFFIFSPITTILVAYLIVQIFKFSFKTKNRLKQILSLAFIILIILVPIKGSFVDFTKTSYNKAKYKIGPIFNPQWQETTDWIKENTPKDSVFAHWWDYGYWVQTMSERATISDGGNAMRWINHYVGRHVLLAHTPKEALEYLKTHKVNYLLITSEEIGKYPAYASIGSDKNYDKDTRIPRFVITPSETIKTATGFIYLFMWMEEFYLDEDFIYKGKLYPKDLTTLIGFIVPIEQINDDTIYINQPTAILIHNNRRIDVPIECVFSNGIEHNYKQKGLGGCLMLAPTVKLDNQISSIERAFYISKKARKTLFTNMYLFDKEWEGFKKVYDGSSNGYILANYDKHKMVYGPIKIWKIIYPPETKTNPNYLNMSYKPDDLR